MTLLQNTAEGGTNGTTVTTANSGGASGTALDDVNIGATSTFTFSSADAQKGTLSYAISGASGETCYGAWLPTNSTQCVFRGYVKFTGLPSAGQYFLRFMNATTTNRASVVMGSSGELLIHDAVAATAHTTSPDVLAINTWYRIEASLDTPTTSTGAIVLKVFAGDSLTPVTGFDISVTGQNFGSGGIAQVRFGKATSAGSWATQRWDDIAFADGTLTLLGPSHSGLTADLAQAEETLVANAITGTKTKTLAQVVETASAQTVLPSVPGVVAWSVEVDWDDDGTFTDVDATRVLDQDAVDISYGRETARALSPQGPGTAKFELNNDSRDYSPENAGSPLFGKVKPGKELNLKATHLATEYTLFQGFLDDLKFDPQDQVVNVTCRDVLSKLTGTEVSTPLHQGVTTGRAINLVLDEIGWPADKRDIDNGATSIRWWWAEGDAGQEVEKIVQSEGAPALITVDASGNFVFRDRHHHLLSDASLTSQATFRDAGAEPVFSSFGYEAGWQEVVNSISFDVDERGPTVNIERMERVDGTGTVDSREGEVWKSDMTYTLEDGEIRVIDAKPGDPIYGALVPAVGIDYIVRAGAVQIWLSRTSGHSVKIFLKATAPTVVEGLRLRAYPVEVTRTVKVTAIDQTSIDAYGVRSYPDDAPWAGVHDARSIAAALLANRAEPLPVVELTLEGGANDVCLTQQLQRDLTDRITVVESHTGMNGDVLIGRITHNITGGGSWLSTTFGCEKVVEQVTNVLRLDSGQLDVNVLGVEGLNDPLTMFVLDESQLDVGLLAY